MYLELSKRSDSFVKVKKISCTKVPLNSFLFYLLSLGLLFFMFQFFKTLNNTQMVFYLNG